jgi:photosystem II stability/assembly factor-like uncharacterized protein
VTAPVFGSRRGVAARLVVAAIVAAIVASISGGFPWSPAVLSAQAVAQAGPRVTTQPIGGSALFFAVHAVSPTVVWASGTGGTIARTVDGGSTWQLRPVPGGDSLQFRDIHAFGADTAFALAIGNGEASRIYRTIDGGNSWTEQFRNTDPDAFYDCFTFVDAQRAVVFGDAANGRTHVLRTTNGGASWALLPPAAVPAPLEGEGAYAASGRCVVHAGERVFIATGGPGSRLFVSDDAGATFALFDTPFVKSASAGTSGLAFRDPMHGIGVAGDMTNLRGDSAQAVVAVTDDGGRTWTLRQRPPLPGALTGVTWVPGAGTETAVAAGFGGVFSTRDAGRSWQSLSDQSHAGLDAFGRTAWVGGRGHILRLDW